MVPIYSGITLSSARPVKFDRRKSLYVFRVSMGRNICAELWTFISELSLRGIIVVLCGIVWLFNSRYLHFEHVYDSPRNSSAELWTAVSELSFRGKLVAQCFWASVEPLTQNCSVVLIVTEWIHKVIKLY